MEISESLKNKLIEFANKYEKPAFKDQDPSQFLDWYGGQKDCEVAAFVAALLSFGSRKAFIPKIRQIFEMADKSGGMTTWLKNRDFEKDFFPQFRQRHPEQTPLSTTNDYTASACTSTSEPKFYRFYSYDDMIDLFSRLSQILNQNKSFGNFLEKEYKKSRGGEGQSAKTLPETDVFQGNDCQDYFHTLPQGNGHQDSVPPVPKDSIANAIPQQAKIHLSDIISQAFPNCKIVPKGRDSANKRIHMYLRWMVRQNSPVDKGFWNWISPADLILPLDVHVLEEAKNLGLIPQKASGSRKTAQLLTEKMAKIFPGDPCRADFALFGLGVDVE